MTFTKRLHEGIVRGDITCSIRIWHRPRVKVGGRYALPPGESEVVSLRGITRAEITTRHARRAGFGSVEDLLRVAQHGEGEFVFLVEFVYHEPG